MSRDGRWTPAQLPEMAGQTVVVTGANSGLGFEGAKAVAGAGATVVLACRRTDRGESAAARIHESVSDADLDVRELDLADGESVRSFAAAFLDAYDELHVLCNNAGVMAIPRRETAEGFEMQFGVNHLGHFALTGLLLDRLVETDGETRVVTQSSGLHERGDVDFDDLHSEREYDKWAAYGQSKLANLLFAYELQRRLRANDVTDTLSVGCHPGYAATNLQRRGPEQAGSTLGLWAMKLGNALLAQSAERGAWPMLFAATAPAVDGGDYVGPGGFMNMRGAPEPQRSSERSYDATLADRLWAVSEELTGVTYDFPALADA